MEELKIGIGAIVHYVSYGTPGGEYTRQCRAAVVTAAYPSEGDGSLANANGPQEVALCVLNPEGMFFNQSCRHSEGAQTGGTWHWKELCDR